MNVFDLLQADGVDVRLSKSRFDCPRCEGKTCLGVQPNKMYAKCFKCGHNWNAFKQEENFTWIQASLDDLFSSCLTALKGSAAKNSPIAQSVMKYLTADRHVLPRVVTIAPLGMVPVDYDPSKAMRAAEEKFTPYYKTLQSDPPMQENETVKGYKERCEAQKGRAIREKMQFDHFISELRNIRSIPGWLAFFYESEPGKLASVKFRNPVDKGYRFLKPKPGHGGVFMPTSPEDGYAPWFVKMTEGIPDREAGQMFVFEGEFNLLTFHSQFARAEGDAFVTQPSCAMGGAKDWDSQTLTTLTRYPIICRDNDDAGREAVAELASKLKTRVLVFSTPEEDSDMDSHLRGVSPENVIAEITKLWDARTYVIRPVREVRDELDVIRSGPMKDFKITRIVTKVVWDDLYDRGDLFWDGLMAYYLNTPNPELAHTASDEDKVLYAIGDSSSFYALLSEYGLLSRNPLTAQVVESLGQRSERMATSSKVHKSAFYDKKTNVSYINIGQNRVVRIDTESITEQDNGDEGVLFLYPDMTPFQIDLYNLPCVKEGLRVSDTPLCREFDGKWDDETTRLKANDYRQLYLARTLMMYLPQLFLVRPMIVARGEAGSGKTAIGARVGWLLEGKEFAVTPLATNPQDLETLLTNKPLVVLDNVDNLQKARANQDLIAIAVTGGRISKRALYTTNSLVDFRLEADLWISTRTNPLDRSDIADRQILLPVLRREEKDGIGELQLQERFASNRDLFMAEIIVRIQNILRALKAERANHYGTNVRLRDFMEFCLRVSHYEGWFAEMQNIGEGLIDAQNNTANSNDPFQEALLMYIGANHVSFRGHVKVKELSASELRQALAMVSERSGVEFPFKNGRSVAEYVKHNRTVLQKTFGFTTRADKARKTDVYSVTPDAETLTRAMGEFLSRGKGTEPDLDDVA